MKLALNGLSRFRLHALTAAFAVVVSAAAQSGSCVVNATYFTGKEVPVTVGVFTATGKTLNVMLKFPPAPGTQLMVVQSTGSSMIRGSFANLEQGQTVALPFGGRTYHFVANYHGGMGNDLVLLWTAGEESIPAPILAKLDNQILLALKKSRGLPPFDKPTSLQPDIPIKYDDSILVDIEASVSQRLLDHVSTLGGHVVKGSETATKFRAMVPVSQLEALAGGKDVNFVLPARVSVMSRIETITQPVKPVGGKP